MGCSQGCSKKKTDRCVRYTSSRLPPSASSGIRKSAQGPIRTTRRGNPTSRNGLISIWRRHSKENDGFSISGKNKPDSAQSATRRSPRSPVGTVTTFSGDPKEDQIEQKTASCCIQLAIGKSTARVSPSGNRVRSHGRNERLEPYVEKFTCTVLRGGMAATPSPYPTVAPWQNLWHRAGGSATAPHP